VEGRLEPTALAATVGQALTAKTYGDLAALTVDLPPVAPADPGEPLVIKAGLHGASRTGRRHVPARVTVYGGMGGARLNFTRTVSRLPEVEVEAHGQWAGVTIVIPESWGAETGALDRGIRGLRERPLAKAPGNPVAPARRVRRNSRCDDPATPTAGSVASCDAIGPMSCEITVHGSRTRCLPRAGPDREITARQLRDVSVQRLAHALIRALTARNGTDAETRRQRARGGPRKRSH
jgi:hypothetical protein